MSRFDQEPTRDEIHDWVELLKAEAKKGADTVHAQAAGLATRQPKLTDAESAAIARAKIEKGWTP